MNVFTAVGRIGRDAQVNHTANGTPVAGIALAVDSGFGDNKQTVWIDCALFGKRAESGLIQYLTKGQQVAVTGELGTRQYQKNDGTQGFSVTLRISEISLVGPQPQGQQAQPQQPAQRPQQQYQQNNPAPTGAGGGLAPVDDFDDDK